MEMIALMHKAVPYGHLLVNGQAPTDPQLASLARTDADQIPSLLDELESVGVFSRTRSRVIYSRRLTRDEKRRIDGETAKITSAKVPGSRRHQADEKQREKPPPTMVVGMVVDQPPSHPEAISQRETNVSLSRAALEAEFERWYAGYPLKKGRGLALKAFCLARKRVSLEVLISSAATYAADCVAKGRKAEFIAHPATWLNGERWSDEADPALPRAAAPSAPASGPDWHSRVRGFRERQFWLDSWGPKPGEPGCLVPTRFLEEVAA